MNDIFTYLAVKAWTLTRFTVFMAFFCEEPADWDKL